jgi:nucleoid-associated protein YgaU
VVDPAVRDRLIQSAMATTSEAAAEAPQKRQAVAQLSENSPWRRIRGNMVVVDADETLGHYAEWLIEYHKGIADDFFGSYEVVSVKDHRVRPGESIWQISTRTYGVPTWLIHRYNPDADLTRLTPGSKLVVPVVQALATQG